MVFWLLSLLMVVSVSASPAVYVACITACNVTWVACYAGAGFVAGTIVASPAAPPIVLACNAAQGACMAACTPLLAAPDPGWLLCNVV